jgi:hypothetical protein
MAKTSKQLKKELKSAGINVKKLFPRSKVDLRKNLTPYQRRKIKKAIKEYADIQKNASGFFPDRPDHYEAAGFVSDGLKHEAIHRSTLGVTHKTYFYTDGKEIFPSGKKVEINQMYRSEGELSFYSASFFGGVAHVVLLPLSELANFLFNQTQIDDEEGRFYDAITLREGDRGFWGQEQTFKKFPKETAEELLLGLEQYKRHGALIGEGGSFDYIQVVFINWGH